MKRTLQLEMITPLESFSFTVNLKSITGRNHQIKYLQKSCHNTCHTLNRTLFCVKMNSIKHFSNTNLIELKKGFAWKRIE